MKILVDMNLSPAWVEFLNANGNEAVHWSGLGDHRASDALIVDWARQRGHALFTQDLDFSALIALAGAGGPSIIQIRTQGTLPEDIGQDVVNVLRRHVDALAKGAIVTIDEYSSRVRVLPIARDT